MKRFRVLICCIVVIVLSLSLTGCDEEEEQIAWEEINWLLHGAWVSANGEVSEKVAVHFLGKLPQEVCADHSLHVTEVQIVFPENFPYREDTNQEVSVICCMGADKSDSYFYCNGFSDKSDSSTVDRMVFYVFPDAELIVFQWADVEGSCFVASTNSNANLSDLLTQYSEDMYIWR